MLELNEEIERIIQNDIKERHSYFQLQFFLIGKEPTIQSRMWRCIRELKTRQESLEALKLEIDDVNDDTALINIDIEDNTPADNDPKGIILFRKLERKKTGLLARLKNLADRKESLQEECTFIVKAFNALENKEPLKPHDDINAQKEYWNAKLGQEFNLRLLFGLPPDLELMKTIMALNADAPVKQDAMALIDSLQNRNNEEQRELDRILKNSKANHNNMGTLNGLKERNGV